MNPIVKELAIRVQRTEMPGALLAHPAFVEKFTESLVKEACGLMGQAEDDLYRADPADRATDYIDWLREWQERFQKHFGVSS